MSLKSTIDRIEFLRSEINSLPPLSDEQKKILDKKFRLEFHYNSNHIEGNTLTYGETELLLFFDETRGNHTLQEYEEMKTSDVALDMVKELADEKERPLTENFIKNLNRILLIRPYWKDAITPDGQVTQRRITVGEYKKHPNSVRLQNGEIFDYASPLDTPMMMAELIEWFQKEITNDQRHPLEIAALLHYKFVRIHPFDDGNGRISRLLMNYVFYYFGYPTVVIKSDDKKEYLRSLHDADTGDIDSFVDYVGTQLLWSLELCIRASKGESVQEDGDWRKKIKILKNNFEAVDTIKLKKTPQLVAETVRNSIHLIAEIIANFEDFEALFIERKTFYSQMQVPGNSLIEQIQPRVDIHWIECNLSDMLNIFELDSKFFENGLRISYDLLEFNKYGYKNENMYIIFNIICQDINYFFSCHRSGINGLTEAKIITKLYHQDINEAERKSIVNFCGELLYEGIEYIINNKKNS